MNQAEQKPAAGTAGPEVGWEISGGEAAPKEPRGDALWRLLRRATLAGVAASLLVHLALWLIAAVVTVSFKTPDAGGAPPGEVDFAVMTSVELATIQQTEIQVETPPAPEDSAPDESLVELMSDSMETDALSPELAELESALGSGEVSDSSSFNAASSGSGGAGTGGGASFFGLEAQGRRFAYIVDRSSSMNADTPSGRTRMELTQRELDRSIEALLESAEFFVVFYSDRATPLGSRRMWSDATARKKLWARRELYRIYPDGGTRPITGFDQVFALRPLPDAIYFMTDGRFLANVPEEIARMNDREMIPVHCVMFGDFANRGDRDIVEQMMRKIASDSGGSFVRVRGVSP